MLDERIYKSYIGILKEEMVPAMGCTEPIALAYGAARAREVLGKEPEHITAKCSGNIIKNVLRDRDCKGECSFYLTVRQIWF
jgi:L-cysteine desulfidase